MPSSAAIDLAAALADGSVDVVDLTQPLSETTPVLVLPEPFANTPHLSRRRLSHFDDAGPAWAWDVLELGEHTGTHLDAPIHWITGREGEDVASIPPSRLAGPVVVVDKHAEVAADPGYLLTAEDLDAHESRSTGRSRGALDLPPHRLGRPRDRGGGVPECRPGGAGIAGARRERRAMAGRASWDRRLRC